MWGVGYLVGATGAALLSGQAMAVTCTWTCCRQRLLVHRLRLDVVWRAQLRRTPVSFIGLAMGPALWLCAFQFKPFAQSMAARISVVAAISASYALLAAREL